jgi:hypothetical protein
VKGNKMTENENPKQDTLNPKFDLNTQKGIGEFLQWLFDPEVDRAIADFTKANGGDVNEN